MRAGPVRRGSCVYVVRGHMAPGLSRGSSLLHAGVKIKSLLAGE